MNEEFLSSTYAFKRVIIFFLIFSSASNPIRTKRIYEIILYFKVIRESNTFQALLSSRGIEEIEKEDGLMVGIHQSLGMIRAVSRKKRMELEMVP